MIATAVSVGSIATGPTGPAAAARAGTDLAFSQDRVQTGESTAQLTIEISRAATDALEASQAWFATADRGGAEGDSDYLSSEGPVELAVGQTTATITVFLFGDDEEEGSESFAVQLLESRHGTRTIDEMTVVIIDDDADTLAASGGDEAAGGTVAAATAQASKVAAASASGTAATPRVVTRTRTTKTARPARKSSSARITPFELQSPGVAREGVPTPAHTTPVAAAGLLAALLLARVIAELWYRWRIDETGTIAPSAGPLRR